MKLPNLSYMMSVGELRYIQSHFETGEYRNPDSLVGMFLTRSKRLACSLRGAVFLSRVRANPFYFYVIARTKYYDEVFLDAVHGPGRVIINIGCGSDTRAYRFAHILKQKSFKVLECDQAEAISVKQEIVGKLWPTDHVEYVPVDLNEEGWPTFVPRLSELGDVPVLVMMEGVSPYVNAHAFQAFLRLLATKLPRGSAVAYDFKRAGVADDFGRSSKSEQLFRLSGHRQEVVDIHRALGYEVTSMELSAELSRRLLPHAQGSFEEDGLLRLVTV